MIICYSKTNKKQQTYFKKLVFASLKTLLLVPLVLITSCDILQADKVTSKPENYKIVNRLIDLNNHTLKFVVNNQVAQFSTFDITDYFEKNINFDQAVEIIQKEGFQEMPFENLDAIARKKSNQDFLKGKIYFRNYHDGPVGKCSTNQYIVYISFIEDEIKNLKSAYGMSPYVILGNCSLVE